MSRIFKPIKPFFKGLKKIIKSITSFVGDAFSFVINPMGSFEQPDISPEAEASGVKITKSGTNVGIPVVYGFRRVGGTIIHVETNGNTNQFLYVVYAICEGEIAGVHRIKIDDNELLPHPGTNNVYQHGGRVSATTGRYANRVEFEIFNGTETQTQSTLADGSASWVGGDRKMPGVAYAVFKFEWKTSTQAEIDSNPFGGGVPQVQFDVFGKKVVDLVTGDVVDDDVVSPTLPFPKPKPYSDQQKNYSVTNNNTAGINPANILLDYLMNPRYGANIPAQQIDVDSFIIAANKFNQKVDYDNTNNGPILTCNVVIPTENKIIDNVKTLVGGCRGMLPFVSGQYKLIVEDGGNATDITSATVNVAFDVSNFFITGTIGLGGETKQSKFNNVFVNYIDPDREFSSQQVVHSEAGDIAIDDDEDLRGEFTFPTVTNSAIAKELARMIYKKSRNQRTINFTATQELADVVPGDIIRVTEEVLNLSNQTFRVVDMKLTNDGLISINGIEHNANDYPHVVGPQIEIPPSVFLPDEYLGRPLQRPVSDPPKGILPPRPPVEDSGGTGDSGPTPPPPYEPIDKPLIDKFYPTNPYLLPDNAVFIGKSNLGGTGYEPTFPLVANTSKGTFETQFFNNTVTIDSRASLLYYMDENGGASFSTGLPCRLSLNTPQDTNITGYIIEAYSGSRLVNTRTSPIPSFFSCDSVNERLIGIGAGERRYYRRLRTSSGFTGDFTIYLNKSLVYKVRAYKRIGGEDHEYKIGGDFSLVSYSTEHQYILLGKRLKDSGLEGFINKLNQDQGISGAGQQNLGG